MTAESRPTIGRPSIFTAELAEEICRRLEEGETLVSICAAKRMPDRATVNRWLAREEHSEFRASYARARVLQADAFHDQGLEIARKGNGDPQSRRLAFDALRWAAGKAAPKKYGDRVDLELSPGSITVNQVLVAPEDLPVLRQIAHRALLADGATGTPAEQEP